MSSMKRSRTVASQCFASRTRPGKRRSEIAHEMRDGAPRSITKPIHARGPHFGKAASCRRGVRARLGGGARLAPAEPEKPGDEAHQTGQASERCLASAASSIGTSRCSSSDPAPLLTPRQRKFITGVLAGIQEFQRPCSARHPYEEFMTHWILEKSPTTSWLSPGWS